ncbi:MAG: hypothetical protein A3H28_09920 [Acidobacteria bacterium RIFCSPLOWO2_02_FULL_61_28]|nr:MAG: hypothetical protein A3H28_09920 [Acidobacteria bacterium RIFCSPLOWO2_02_FULL_61_28]
MPIFEYVCEECRRPFEKLVLKREETISCPSCGSGRYRVQFSVTAAPAKSGTAASASASCCPTGGCGCN